MHSLVKLFCRGNQDVYKKYHHNKKFSFGPSHASICTGLELTYNWNCFCNLADIPGDVAEYSKIFINCGQHPASSKHHTAAEYRDVILKLVDGGKRKKLQVSKLVWIESVPMPVRNDALIKEVKDWRTYHRIMLFNNISETIMRKHNVTIVRAFGAVLPLVDKLCDGMHYTAENAVKPILYSIAREFF